MKSKGLALMAMLATAASPALVHAAEPVRAPQEVPAKALPVPTADISPGMQAFIGAPLNPDWNAQWKTGEEARGFANIQASKVLPGLPAMKDRMGVTVQPASMGAFGSIRSRQTRYRPKTPTSLSSMFMVAAMFCFPARRERRKRS